MGSTKACTFTTALTGRWLTQHLRTSSRTSSLAMSTSQRSKTTDLPSVSVCWYVVEIENSNVSIDNCTFVNNTAISGGTILVSWYYLTLCTNSITNSYFANNIAVQRGGAIIYNSYQPNFVNNVFVNNSASFRPNIANYAVKLMMVTDRGALANLSSISGLPSGLKIETAFSIAVVNNEEQVMSNDNKNAVRILPLDAGTDVKGQSTVVLNNGIAKIIYYIYSKLKQKHNNIKMRNFELYKWICSSSNIKFQSFN